MRGKSIIRFLLITCSLTVLIWQISTTAFAAEIACDAVEPGKPFESVTVPITLTDVNDLSAIEFKLKFNKQVIELEPDDITGKAFRNSALLGNILLIKNEVTSTGDTLEFAAARLDDSTLNVLGKATLGTIKFKSLKEGKSALTFSKTWMLNSTGTDIQHSVLGGVVLFDGTKPYIALQKPAPGMIMTDPRPVVAAMVGDALSGVNQATISVKVDGKAVAAENHSNYVSYLPEENVSSGTHTVAVYLEDYAANTQVSEWSFSVKTPTDTGVLKGRILPQGIQSGLSGTRVVLEKDGKISEAVTAPDGRFEFLNVSPGSYKLEAKRTGFLGQIIGVHSIQPGQCVVIPDKEIPFGDLNSDDAVNLRDLAEIARAYAQKPGGTLWKAIYDVNENGEVDKQDLETLGENYGLFTHDSLLLD